MAWRVEVLDRNDIPVRAEQLALTPTFYSAHVWGGPKRAEIRVEGAGDALWQALNWLRGWVTIRNAQGNLVWWGYVASAEVGIGQVTVGLTLETMANRVCVAYTYMGPDGQQTRGTTAWAEDTTVQALYGIKELRATLADTSPGQATAVRAKTLAARKNPQAMLAMDAIEGGRLMCIGAWQTLGWQSYSQPEGRESHEAAADEEVILEVSTGGAEHTAAADEEVVFFNEVTQVGQAFQVASTTTVRSLAVRARKNGSPTYELRLHIYTNGETGSPHSALASASVPPASVGATSGWVSANLSSDLVLAAATNYWVVVDAAEVPTLEESATTGYAVGVETGKTYAGGWMKIFDVAHDAWVFRVPDADMPFIVDDATTTPRERVGQKFQLATATGWTVRSVAVQARKIGAPTDNFRMRIYSDSGGNPNAVLAMVTVAAADVATSADWVSADLATNLALSPATNYWIVVDSTGSPSAATGYAVGIETAATYPRGNLKVYSGSWAANVPDADMPFLLLGSEATSLQMEEMLASGQFVTAVDMRVATGVEECQYRDGTLTIRDEAERLLGVGTASEAGLRAWVSPGRQAVVDAEPAEGETELLLGMDGRLYNAVGGLADEGVLPVGQWVRIEGVPSRAGLLANAARFFVESAEYDVDGGRLRLTPRSTATA